MRRNSNVVLTLTYFIIPKQITFSILLQLTENNRSLSASPVAQLWGPNPNLWVGMIFSVQRRRKRRSSDADSGCLQTQLCSLHIFKTLLAKASENNGNQQFQAGHEALKGMTCTGNTQVCSLN